MFGGFNPFGFHGANFHEAHDDDGFEDENEGEEGGEVDNKKLYEILELEPGASIEDVKKQYRKLARQKHPDKGGDPEEFRVLTKAYEVLSNEEKKKLYDKYGEKGLEMGGGINPFAEMFGFGGGQGQKGQKKVRPRQEVLKVTLEDVYLGKLITAKIKRKKICDDCEGKGAKDAKTCPDCKGQRIVVKMIQMAPGMFAQQEALCETCKGKGFVLEKGQEECKTCSGRRIVDQEKEIDVGLEKGMPDGHRISFVGMGDELPDAHAGDIAFEVQIQPHEQFLRKGADLYYEKKISLKEALLGTQFSINHLDGEVLHLSTQDITKPNQIKCVPHKGMPFFKDSMNHGHLFIQFQVEFPEQLNQQQKQLISQALPGNIETMKAEDVIELQPFDVDKTNPHEEGGHKEDQEDDHEGGPRVQCAQQ